jgi:catechol 2,3-dioxygenase-like lactoylglutathione lyase family enzyme
MRVKMCSVHVTDPAKAYAFYTATLGFEELLVVPEANLYVVRSPEDRHGVGLLLEPEDNPIAHAYREGLYSAGIPAIVFGVAELHDEYDRLVAAGVRFTGEPVTDDSGTHVTFDDTCGNFVRLHED